jgi:hypothetical protein
MTEFILVQAPYTVPSSDSSPVPTSKKPTSAPILSLTTSDGGITVLHPLAGRFSAWSLSASNTPLKPRASNAFYPTTSWTAASVVTKPPPTGARAWYRRLVALYPRNFKQRFGAEVIQLFDDIYHDVEHAPPRQRIWHLTLACLDTLVSISQEQITAIHQLLTKDLRMSKKSSPSSSRSFISRHPRATVISLILLVITLGVLRFIPSLIASASGVFLRERTISQTERHSDQARVTSLFVNDYIMAKNGLATKRPVGYDSPLAMNKPGYSLKNVVQDSYKHIEPGFDPLICSSSLPAKATFDTDLTGPSLGFATVTARFTYPNNPVETTATYLLAMKTGADEGWHVVNVSCTSLKHSAQPPFTLSVQPNSELSIEAPYSSEDSSR